jgi:hypothetical protein
MDTGSRAVDLGTRHDADRHGSIGRALAYLRNNLGGLETSLDENPLGGLAGSQQFQYRPAPGD